MQCGINTAPIKKDMEFFLCFVRQFHLRKEKNYVLAIIVRMNTTKIHNNFAAFPF